MRHQHQEQAGQRAGERISDRPPPADDLHQKAGERLAWNACEEHQRAEPETQTDSRALIDQRLRQQHGNQEICCAGANPGEDTDGGPAHLATLEQSPVRRQFLARGVQMAAEVLRRQRRHRIAATPDDVVDDVRCHLAAGPCPDASAGFRDDEPHQYRNDCDRQSTRQCQQAKRVRVAGEQECEKRHQGKRGRQRHLIDCAISAPMLCRHQLGRDRERR